MLSTDQRYVLSLLRESFGKNTGENLPPTDSHGASSIITRNSILLTVYQKLSSDLKQQLMNHYNMAIKQAIVQKYEGERVLRALSEAGLSCIALKGWELRKLYPEPTMRQMADLDILVHPYDFQIIK